jgi:hypothetical protein
VLRNSAWLIAASGLVYDSEPNGQRIGGKMKARGITAGLIAHVCFMK